MSDDRPKKSWSEIDKLRDGTRKSGPRSGSDDYNRERAADTAAYSSYKSKIDKMFTPGGLALPDHLKAKLGPQSESERASRALLDQLKEKSNAVSLKAVITAGLALPEDARLLMGLLGIEDDELVFPVLEKLLEIVESGKRPNRMLLIQKIDALIMRECGHKVTELAQVLRAALG